eukprot:GEZU01003263.1.p1 GENE.GEZU01003263.1~~GEZU01003263.1.p1  ORF type:complete len:406 (+),score=117.34 GEZU01003263.1:100-1218(+)
MTLETDTPKNSKATAFDNNNSSSTEMDATVTKSDGKKRPTKPGGSLKQRLHEKRRKAASKPMSKKRVLRRTIIAVCVSLIFIFTLITFFCLFYFGALWDTTRYLHNLDMAIFSADVGVPGPNNTRIVLGPALAQSIASVNNTNPKANTKPFFHWEILQDVTSLEDLMSRVDDMKYWGALYFPPDFTAKLLAAVKNGRATMQSSPYTANNYISFIVDEGRQQNNLQAIRKVVTTIVTGVNNKLAQGILAGQYGAVNVSNADLSALVTPLVLKEVNLHPIQVSGMSFTSYLGMTILWLGALFAVNSILTSTVKLEGLFATRKIVLARIGLGIIFPLFNSLIVAVIIRAMGLDFAKVCKKRRNPYCIHPIIPSSS